MESLPVHKIKFPFSESFRVERKRLYLCALNEYRQFLNTSLRETYKSDF